MHSRIFHITKEPENYTAIDPERYYEWPPADYVTPMDKENVYYETNEWLKGRTGFNVDSNKATIQIKSKEEALKPFYKGFMDGLKDAQSMSFEEFSEKWPFHAGWEKAKNAFSQEYGIYFDDNDEDFGMVTLQDFIRSAKEGVTYHVVGVFDYHY